MLVATNGGTPALYVVPAAGGAARRVAAIPGSVHAPRFAPNGAQVTVLYASPAEQADGPLAATPRDTEVIDRHVDRQHLALVDVASGAVRTLTAPDLYADGFDWASDGRQLVAGVPTQLVVYPDEGHAFADPAHRRDVRSRPVAWFDRYLRPRAAAPARPAAGR